MLSEQRLALVGAGNMGEALLRGLLEAGLLSPRQISVAEPSHSRAQYIRDTYSVQVLGEAARASNGCKIVLLAVKPQVLETVLGELAGELKEEQLIISIAAGKKIAFLEQKLGKGKRIVRVMPNTPALVRCAASAVCAGEGVPQEDLALAVKIFEAVGRVVTVPEQLMDAVTALSGSGPAYAFVIIEALADAGVNLGLSRETALELAAQTLLGAARLVLEKQEHPARLKDMVCSPAGTTIAAVQALEQAGVRAGLMAAVRAAAERSRELAA